MQLQLSSNSGDSDSGNAWFRYDEYSSVSFGKNLEKYKTDVFLDADGAERLEHCNGLMFAIGPIDADSAEQNEGVRHYYDEYIVMVAEYSPGSESHQPSREGSLQAARFVSKETVKNG